MASSAACVASEEGHKHLGVRTAPTGYGVPARPSLVTGNRPLVELGRVVARGDVVKGMVVLRAAGDLVNGWVDEAKVPLRVLVSKGDDPGPGGRSSARAAVSADRVATAAIARDDRKPGVGTGVSRYIGDTAHCADAADAILIRGPTEELTEPPARRLHEGARVAIGKAPCGLADPGAGRVARIERGAPGAEDKWVRCDESDLLRRRVARSRAAERRDKGTRLGRRTGIAGGRNDSDVVSCVVLQRSVQLDDLGVGDAVLPADLPGWTERDDATFRGTLPNAATDAATALSTLSGRFL